MLKIDLATKNNFANEPERVIVYDDFGSDLINGYISFSGFVGTETMDRFLDEFEIVGGGDNLARKSNRFGEGIYLMVLIKRKSDDKLFGFEKYQSSLDTSFEPNGHMHGIEYNIPYDFNWGVSQDDDNADYLPLPYVFFPVEPFIVTGYQLLQ